MTKRGLKILKKVLKESKAYTKFKINVRRDNRLIADISAPSIGMAFIWSDSPEGYEYWYDLDSKLDEEIIKSYQDKHYILA